MATTRARSANGDDRQRRAVTPEVGAPQGNQEIIRDLIQEMRRQRQQPTEIFKAPEYNGVGSVEIFIRHFLDIAEANNWSEGATFLHLRRALKEGASDCGGAGNDVGEILAALRARYGISPREARAKLGNLKREYKVPLQEHAGNVKELMRIAYSDLNPGLVEEMGLDHFVNSLNHAALQRHLLAVRPDSIPEAVVAGNEFLQIKSSYSGVKKVEGSDEDMDTEVRAMPVQAMSPLVSPSPEPAGAAVQVQPVIPQPVLTQPLITTMPGPPQSDPMAVLVTALAQLTSRMDDLQRSLGERRGGRGKITCWGCKKEGHLQSKCPEKKAQGNPDGQQ